jgi:hypothetical protein
LICKRFLVRASRQGKLESWCKTLTKQLWSRVRDIALL